MRCCRRRSSVGRQRASARWRPTQLSRSLTSGSTRFPEVGLGEESCARSTRAIAVFEELGDEAGLARALTLAGKLRFWGGEAAAALQDLERGARMRARRATGPRRRRASQYVLASDASRPDAGRRSAGTARGDPLARRDEPEARGRPPSDARAARGDAGALRRRARPDRAGEGLAEEHGLGSCCLPAASPTAGYIELLAGDPAAAERELRPACEALERLGNWASFRASRRCSSMRSTCRGATRRRSS